MTMTWEASTEAQRSLAWGGLTAPQQSLVAAIVAGKLAWSGIADLATAGHAPETLAELEGLGIVERWGEPHVGRMAEATVTLSPWGAWVRGVEIVERIEIRGEELEEDPVWAERPAAPRRVVLPRRAHETRFPWMEAFPDPLPGPEVLVDEVSEEPVKMFAGAESGDTIDEPSHLKGGLSSLPASKGVPVRIDRRLAKKAKANKGTKAKAKKPSKSRRRAG
jgi:hypothetical protein